MSDLKQIALALDYLNEPPVDVMVRDIRSRKIGAHNVARALAVLFRVSIGEPVDLRNLQAAREMARLQNSIIFGAKP